MGVFTETVVPVFGNLLATAMLTSPIPAVLRMRKSGKLGDINLLPYPMTCVNCAGWVAYGYASRNPYVFPGNIVGLLAGMFFTLTAFSCSSRKGQDLITTIFVSATAYFVMLGLISCFGLEEKASQRLWGTSAVVILMLYYVVPLSTMVAIVRTRNAASIYPPLAVTAIANGTMWTVYGLAVNDINLWLPNGFGAVIGAVQLLLRLVYGARSAPDGAAGGTRADGELAFVKSSHSDAARVDERLDSTTNLLGQGRSPGLSNGNSTQAHEAAASPASAGASA